MPQKKSRYSNIVIKELEDIPGRVLCTRDFFDKVNTIVHYYLERFGPYVPSEKRRNLTRLSLEADRIFLEIEALYYEVKSIKTIMKAFSQLKKKYDIPEEKKKKLKDKIDKICTDVLEFYEKTTQEIDDLIKIVEKKGVD